MIYSNNIDRENTLIAWEHFIKTGEILSDKVRKEIADSWLRCKELNVDAYDTNYPKMSKKLLFTRQQDLRNIMAYAVPVCSAIKALTFAKSTSLVDKDGFGYYFISELEEDPSSYGIFVEEKTCGNAISTIIARTMRPIILHGYEQYRLVDQNLTSAGSPIFIEGTYFGTISVGSPLDSFNDYDLTITENGAKFIGNMCSEQTSSYTPFRALFAQITNYCQKPVMVLDENGNIINTNHNCERITGIVGSLDNYVPIRKFLEDQNTLKHLLTSPDSDNSNFVFCLIGPRKKNLYCQILKRVELLDPADNQFYLLIFDTCSPGQQNQVLYSPEPIKDKPKYKSDSFDGFVGESLPWLKIMQKIERVAQFPTNVLITGETGTGKEVAAKNLHRLSKRIGPFVAVNCGALTESLLQSELFGYEKNAFTGASSSGHIGKIEHANKGTLFLDEVSEMSLAMQTAILRVIQEREVTRVGSNSAIKIDIRIIAASNKNMMELVRENKFRQDLYYRLNVIRIDLPPLRNRKSDIPLLINYYLDKISTQYNLPKPHLLPSAYDILSRYPWPGNIRELRNVVEQIVIMNDGKTITADAVQPIFEDWYDVVHEPEDEQRTTIIETLSKCGGNISKAARNLNISRETLYRKMAKYNIDSKALKL